MPIIPSINRSKSSDNPGFDWIVLTANIIAISIVAIAAFFELPTERDAEMAAYVSSSADPTAVASATQ